jgi:hypothetical protein
MKTTEPIEKDDDHMTIGEFIDAVHSGLFNDNDGHGVYADYTSKDVWSSFDEEVYPSDVYSNHIDLQRTHIVWYNK